MATLALAASASATSRSLPPSFCSRSEPPCSAQERSPKAKRLERQQVPGEMAEPCITSMRRHRQVKTPWRRFETVQNARTTQHTKGATR